MSERAIGAAMYEPYLMARRGEATSQDAAHTTRAYDRDLHDAWSVPSGAMGAFELSLAELRARPGTKWHRFADDVIPAWIAEMDFHVAEPIQAGHTLAAFVSLGGNAFAGLMRIQAHGSNGCEFVQQGNGPLSVTLMA